jgi:hypothetical protein
MDHIQITIEQESVDESALFIQVAINGNSLPGILNTEAFFALKEHNGRVPLFTCGCGEFGCGGYYVNVSTAESALILRNSYHRFDHSLQSTFEYQLDWSQIRSIAEEILAYLQQIQVRNPDAYVTVGYGGANLLDRLLAYSKSSLLVP